MYLPETKAFSLVFESAGYKSVYIIVLLGSTFILTIIILVLLFVDVVLLFIGRKWPNIVQIRRKTT